MTPNQFHSLIYVLSVANFLLVIIVVLLVTIADRQRRR